MPFFLLFLPVLRRVVGGVEPDDGGGDGGMVIMPPYIDAMSAPFPLRSQSVSR